MIVRIVKMSFKPETLEDFQALFDRNKEKIRGFEGNEFLELYQDRNNKNIFFTYSYWKDDAALEHYRHSDLFKGVWSETKKMFNDKPEAWSVDKKWSSDK
jgi:quinol monooxygenase YgiN